MTTKSNQLFLLEFNELCPHLLAEFRKQGHLPNFQKLYETSAVFTTDAGEAAPHLEPWIQWMTVHSGMTYADHGAFHLGDGRQVSQKCLAELLSDSGVRVGVFGSMNTNYRRLNGYYVPDPWDAKARPEPSWLSPFFDVVSSQVQESSGNKGLSKRDVIRFGRFMISHGLKAKTLIAIFKQLFDERLQPALTWRRASLLEKVQYDLFVYLNKKFCPQFSTFFCNSTAHYQHYYWRNMHPDIFEMPPDKAEHPSLRTAILYGYQQMDILIGQFLRDFPETTLILCTALSQQPWTDTTKCTFRPRDFQQFLNFAGVGARDIRVEPVMAEEFRLSFPSKAATRDASAKLGQLTYEGSPLLKMEVEAKTVFGGCAVIDARAMQGSVANADGKSAAFRDLFHMVHSVRSGRHHPDGVLWIREGTHCVINDKVPLTSIAPTILAHFGLDCPHYMKAESLDSVTDRPLDLVAS